MVFNIFDHGGKMSSQTSHLEQALEQKRVI